MRVAMLAPIAWRVPPRRYGPWEQVVYDLTEALLDLGVEVVLYATCDSETRAPLRCTAAKPLWEDPEADWKVEEFLHIARAMEEAGEFDLVHNHYDFMPLYFTPFVRVPVLTTIHGFSSEKIKKVYRRYAALPHVHYVAISEADKDPGLPYLGVVHHGVDPRRFRVGEGGRHLLVLSRIHPDKGIREAILFARKSRLPLKIAGPVQDEAYFQNEVAPLLGEGVEFLGPVDPETRQTLLDGAIALLHFVNFKEPFGLAPVEAMMSGVPVLARPLGALPETVRHGETGFLVRDWEEALEYLEAVRRLDRWAIRRYAEARFSRERMARDYLGLYRKVVGA
ncbi:glycosyl transferase group 1 [Thermus thermophilus SG0.5JP17-16]|uniref:Glycosyl transferase group 1 n=1 Tax=Thermus thermophilus (strain SG0.5JP17-16) TaxID=762633 RepID=F6DF33_THETG|nr:glycosyltransferase family 4 protein [Thermus thermophilus]AEG34162.1 glycosyl transferase group 1 [Thermus thermophilus SG0.5JP17-16]